MLQLCKVLEVSRSAYYDYKNEKSYVASENELELMAEVKRIFEDNKKRYGAMRIWAEMGENGSSIGIYKVRSLMKKQGLHALQPKGFVPKTTQSHPHLKRSPNLLLEPCNLPDAPNQVIVGDITYLLCEENGKYYWLYLAVWMDLFSRKIVGWQVDNHMEASLVILAFQMVLKNRNLPLQTIAHSDGGGQYGSILFRQLLTLNGIKQSMTRKDNHYDNAHMESFFSRFKTELMTEGAFTSLEDARFKVFQYIEAYYNPNRRHSALGYISPNQFEQKFYNQNLL